jgi:hypothetical protein
MPGLPQTGDDMRGWLLWYAFPERSFPHCQLVAAARETGFPQELLPEPLDRRAAWEQAFSLPETGLPVPASSSLRQRCPDPGLSCRLYVRVVRRRMPYVRHLELEVICPGALSPEEQRRTALVAVLRLDDRGHSTATVIGPWVGIVEGEAVADAVRRMEEEYRRLLEACPPGAPREAVRRYLRRLSALRLRAPGALYYVPHSSCPDGKELMVAREFAHRSSGAQLTYLRLLAGDAQAVADVRAAVVDSLRQRLAAIHAAAVRLREVQDHEQRQQMADRLLAAFTEAAGTAARVRESLRDTLQELEDLIALTKGAIANA